ncbi:Acyl-CoA synthetase, putative [Hondaea fermentalgiana]|uniref:Acyl-CoA synthetase, putative n=1 Tax=Hondaea fermentalgiana TaxID=2315210 RepID=A0A2R5H162_9STRA|nr:Acyl-CoA synthetase, putative [Hondaea fermentalgiana]|eukprot:GBG34813.1 Acyl-CoA synthetase, putative [Hondaea fermentalgiana]
MAGEARLTFAQTAGLVAAAALLVLATQFGDPTELRNARERPPARAARLRSASSARTQTNSDKTTASKPQYAPLSLNMTLASAARSHPNRIAVIHSDGSSSTYAQLTHRAACVATALSRNLKLETGSRVAVLALNAPNLLEVFWACPHAGLLLIPVNARLAPPEIINVLNRCEPIALFVDDAFAAAIPRLLDQVSSLKHIIYVGHARNEPAPDGALHYETQLIDSISQPMDPVTVLRDDCLGIFFSAKDTTRHHHHQKQQQQAVMLSHENILASAFCALRELAITPDSRYAHIVPMSHISDFVNTVAITMVGAANVFVPKFSPHKVVNVLREQNVTQTFVFPSMLEAILDAAEDNTLPDLCSILCGAAPVSEDLLRRVTRLLGDQVRCVHGLFMTEVTFLMTVRQAHDPLNTVGKSVPHLEIRIVDDNDSEVPHGTMGHLQARGASVMLGYLDNQSENNESMLSCHGWFTTGVKALIDPEGFVLLQE